MNAKQLSLVASLLLSGVGCATLARPEVSVLEGSVGKRMAIASGPALVQISSSGSGTATLYLTDDPGDGSATCAVPGAEESGSVTALNDDDYAADLPVPTGKRVCATFDSPALTMDWLVEDYSQPGHALTPPATATPSPEPGARLLLAKQ